jgi:hypothetical protein
MDNGFGLASGNWADNSWKANQYKGSLNDFVQLDAKHGAKKESDWLANGDEADDKEVQSELGDPEDPVVMDNGFALASGNWADNSWKANQYKGSLNDFVQLDSNVDIKTRVASKVAALNRRESDYIANADRDDDKEVESELGDGEDEIVTDNGFALAGGNWADNSWKQNQYAVQLGQKVHRKKHHHKKHHKHHRKPHNKGAVQLRGSGDFDIIANADAADDLEVESELGDASDEIVMDNGFALSSGNWAGDENRFKNDQYTMVQTGAKTGDLFLTETYKADHPNHIPNAMYQNQPEGNDALFLQMNDLFLTQEYKDEHPNRIPNAMATPLNKDVDEVLIQTGDHYFTQEFNDEHPNKIPNAMYQASKEDVIDMQIDMNEIDNFNPRA